MQWEICQARCHRQRPRHASLSLLAAPSKVELLLGTVADLVRFSAVGTHHPHLPIAAVGLREIGNPLPIRRPYRVCVWASVGGELSAAAAIGIHHINVALVETVHRVAPKAILRPSGERAGKSSSILSVAVKLRGVPLTSKA
jgi:hypothetical protein